LEKVINVLLPPAVEMDEGAAAIILEREGIDRGTLSGDLRGRLKRRVDDLRGQGKEVTPRSLEVIAILESPAPP
jgi:hypothetical protein